MSVPNSGLPRLPNHSHHTTTTNTYTLHQHSLPMAQQHNSGIPQQQDILNDSPPHTSTVMSLPAHKIVEEIKNIHLALSKLPSLTPGPPINALLTRLVELCTRPYSKEFSEYIMNTQEAEDLSAKLRPICGQAEGELESHWARHILSTATTSNRSICACPLLIYLPITIQSNSDPASPALLTLFPYHDNYTDLSRLECSALEAFLPSCSPTCRPMPCSIAFIGSGPLPLTSFCVLDRYPDAVVHNIDRDIEALKLSDKVAKVTGYARRMRFVCEDVSLENDTHGKIIGPASKKEWMDAEVVFLAALVGMDTASKSRILRALAKGLRPGTLIVVRSARGLRGVLYPVSWEFVPLG